MLDPTPFLWSQRLQVRGSRYLDRLSFRVVAARINRELRESISRDRPDYVWIFKGLHVRPESLTEARRAGAVVFNFNWDDFHNPVHGSPYFARAFTQYDLILTPRRHCTERYRANGARTVEHLGWAFDPDIHYPVDAPPAQREEWGAPVAFVGSWSRRRQEIVGALAEFETKVWGGSWWRARRALARSRRLRIIGRTASCEDMSRVINASDINLNILTLENNDRTNLRNLEIPACGGFQLAERTAELLEMFNEDKEVVCYGSTEELQDKCRYYLEHAGPRTEIARAGRARLVRSGHTYLDRTREILELLAGL